MKPRLLAPIVLSWSFAADRCHGAQSDRGGHLPPPTQRQETQNGTPPPPTGDGLAEPRLFQSGGYLCTAEECYHASDLDPVLKVQFQLSQLPHNCRDIRGNCAARAQRGDCTGAAPSEDMHAYCPRTCGVCHNRTRAVGPAELAGDAVVTTRGGTTRRRPQQHRTESKAVHRIQVYAKTEANANAFIPDGSAKDGSGTSPQTPPPPPQDLGRDRPTASDAILDAYGSNLGVPQILYDGDLRIAILELLREARDYVDNVIMYDNRYRVVRDKCRHAVPYCAAWAALGYCEAPTHEDYMALHCAPICGTCQDLHVEAKCPVDFSVRQAWYPGDLNRMFERILREQAATGATNVTVLSSPDATGGPWVLQMDDFLSAAEADRLVALGAREGYQRSEDVGDEGDDGDAGGVVSAGRTSTNAWCQPQTCESDPVPQAVLARIEALTGIHRNHSEALQLLRYEPGQFYEEHHDYIDLDRERLQGSRILTVYTYLNDVAAGGGTNFPALGLTVQPRRGRALLWPSVLDDQPHDKDARTNHQALPVEAGVKYGANAWLHQRHFRTAVYELRC